MQFLITLILALFGVGSLGAAASYYRARTIPRPDDAGNGELTPCPQSPNCVSSIDTDQHGMEPLPYSGSLEAAMQKLLAVIEALPRATVVKQAGTHLYVETRSPTMGFPDDVEFVFDDEAKVINFRSAARMGYGDMNKNRERMQIIRQAFLASDE
ncbi:MAG: DUF1499 domain-containing protein [Chloroflexota bacterium]